MKPGATLLGVVDEDGQIEWAPPGLVVDEEFVRIAKEGRDPLKRFRFSKPCLEGGCSQWKGTHCGVVESVLDNIEGGPRVPDSLRDCAIRSECRWFRERGAQACEICPEVMTKGLFEETV
jgi:hypothetical protein